MITTQECLTFCSSSCQLEVGDSVMAIGCLQGNTISPSFGHITNPQFDVSQAELMTKTKLEHLILIDNVPTGVSFNCFTRIISLAIIILYLMLIVWGLFL
jgi:hypothetical protein